MTQTPPPSNTPKATQRGSVDRFAFVAMIATLAAQAALRPTGPGNSSPVDVFILISILAAAIWVSSARVPVRAPYVVGVALMVIGGAVAGATGPLPGTAVLALIQDLGLIAWCTALVAVARTPHRLRMLAKAWAYAGAICAGVLLVGSLAHITAITGIVAREGNRVLFTFGDPNYAATYWVLTIFIIHACQAPRSRLARLLAYGLLVWALLLSESNGGVVELALGCLLLVVLAALRRHGPAAAMATLLIIGGSAAVALQLVPFSSIQTWARGSGQPILVNSLGRSNDSSAQRGELLQEALQLYNANGGLGSGPASTKPLLLARSYPYAKEAHNDYLATLVERGPVGLLGLIALMASAAWRAGQIVRAGSAPPGPGALPKPAGLVAALFAVSVAATYYEVLHFRFVWALLAMAAALAFQCTERRFDGRGQP
ncbi:MAG: O-antigen ligase family protein [Actinomycetota bacterium]|nr:O-antigen ligase family protein [Actinomycetota bacterium]